MLWIDDRHWDLQDHVLPSAVSDLYFFELLEAVSKLVARNAQKFGCTCLVAATSLDSLPDKRQFSLIERNTFIWQDKPR